MDICRGWFSLQGLVHHDVVRRSYVLLQVIRKLVYSAERAPNTIRATSPPAWLTVRHLDWRTRSPALSSISWENLATHQKQKQRGLEKKLAAWRVVQLKLERARLLDVEARLSLCFFYGMANKKPNLATKLWTMRHVRQTNAKHLPSHLYLNLASSCLVQRSSRMAI